VLRALWNRWYLPLLLAAFVFHSRHWNTAEEDEETALAKARKLLSRACVHEVMIQEMKANSPHLCPAVVTDKAVEISKGLAEEATGAVVPQPSSSP
jgi:hypothetical protein